MFKDITAQVWVNLGWLIKNIRWVGKRLVELVIVLWLIAGTVGIGLVLPVYLVMGKMVKSNRVNTASRDTGQNRVGGYQVYSVRSNLNLGQVRNSASGQGYEMVRNEIERANESVNELRRFGKGIESLIGR
jgi:hypothetical protein